MMQRGTSQFTANRANSDGTKQRFNNLKVSNDAIRPVPVLYSTDVVKFTRTEVSDQKLRDFEVQSKAPVLQRIVEIDLFGTLEIVGSVAWLRYAQWLMQHLGFAGARFIQEALCKDITEGYHTRVIAEPRSGRTLGYTVAVFSSMLRGGMLHVNGDTPTIGTVVLCLDDSDVGLVGELFDRLANALEAPAHIVKFTFIEIAKADEKLELLAEKGCHILVVSPLSLHLLLRNHDHLVNKMRYLVLDDGDALFATQPSLMNIFVDKFEKCIDLKRQKEESLQVIITCSKWSKDLNVFSDRFCQNPRLAAAVVSAGLEMIAFHGFQPKIHMVGEQDKISLVEGILNDLEQTSPCAKVLVCCTSIKEAANLWMGKKTDQNHHLVLEKMKTSYVMSVQQQWKLARNQSVVIVVDSMLSTLNIREADCLIHYDVTSSKDFDYRHTCLIEKTTIKGNSKTPPVSVHIMVDDDTTQDQVRRLLQLHVRMDWELPVGLEAKAKLEPEESKDFFQFLQPSAGPSRIEPIPVTDESKARNVAQVGRECPPVNGDEGEAASLQMHGNAFGNELSRGLPGEKKLFYCEVFGNVLKAKESLVITIGEDFVMTRGLTRACRKIFGGVCSLKKQEKTVGQVAVLYSGGRFVFYLVAKQFTSRFCLPTIKDMEVCLMNLREYCMDHNVTELAMPRIGSGRNGLVWSEVKEIIEHIFWDMDFTITVYRSYVNV